LTSLIDLLLSGIKICIGLFYIFINPSKLFHRLSDGSVIVVDAVLKQAWLEHIRPVLVFNKIDRLITEMKLKPLDACISMIQLLEQVNSIDGEPSTIEVMSKAEGLADASWGVDEADDSDLHFAPEQGNVVFASAADGWGLSLVDFARMFASKLGVDQKELVGVLSLGWLWLWAHLQPKMRLWSFLSP
jgi:ribosome assembly protein 1